MFGRFAGLCGAGVEERENLGEGEEVGESSSGEASTESRDMLVVAVQLCHVTLSACPLH